MKTALVIMNPIAGARTRKDIASFVQGIFRRHGIRADLCETGGSGEAQSISQTRGREYDIVICAGGDGTINEVAYGIYGTDIPLGIIPLGTANVLARDLGVPLQPEQACETIVTGKPERMDVGIVRYPRSQAQPGNGERAAEPGSQRDQEPENQPEHIFLCMAGAGFDAAVAHAYKQVRGKSSRFYGYLLPIIQSIRDFEFPKIAITVDGRAITKPASSVIVGNVRSYGGPFTLTPHAVRDDGVLHVCALLARNRRDLMRCLWATIGARHIEYPDVLHLPATRITLQADAPVHLQLDGDAVGSLPVSITIAPRALSIIVPRQRR